MHRHSHKVLCAWQLSWLAVERPWSASIPYRGSISGTVGRVFTGWRAMAIESLPMSGCSQGNEPQQK